MPADVIFVPIFLLLNVAIWYAIRRLQWFNGVRPWAVIIWLLLLPLVGFFAYLATIPFGMLFDIDCGSITSGGAQGCQLMSTAAFSVFLLVVTLPLALIVALIAEAKKKKNLKAAADNKFHI